jgi:hypothetical protein
MGEHIISLHKLVALLDEEDAVDSDSGIGVCHIVVGSKMANKEG